MSSPGARFDELVRIMATLRSPDGCPWDRAQTLASLRPFLLDETYETLEALDRGDLAGLREELGDLLFEVVFLARICEEDGHFTVSDAIDTIARKLVRRHPHVFGDDERLTHADEVLGKWEELKAAERASTGEESTGERKTLLSGVPTSLPALLRAHEYGSRAAAVGFDWARADDVIDKIDEEVKEIRVVIDEAARDEQGHTAGATRERLEEEMGDLLFAIANLSRKLGVEPESALRRANDKFRTRFTEVEERVERRGERLQDKSLEELEEEWQRVKGEEA